MKDLPALPEKGTPRWLLSEIQSQTGKKKKKRRRGSPRMRDERLGKRNKARVFPSTREKEEKKEKGGTAALSREKGEEKKDYFYRSGRKISGKSWVGYYSPSTIKKKEILPTKKKEQGRRRPFLGFAAAILRAEACFPSKKKREEHLSGSRQKKKGRGKEGISSLLSSSHSKGGKKNADVPQGGKKKSCFKGKHPRISKEAGRTWALPRGGKRKSRHIGKKRERGVSGVKRKGKSKNLWFYREKKGGEEEKTRRG